MTLLLPRGGNVSGPGRQESVVVNDYAGLRNAVSRVKPGSGSVKPDETPEAIVGSKVSQFGRSRREIAFGLARKHGTEVPAEVERFFNAVEAGNWDELDALFNSLEAQHKAKPSVAEVDVVWPAILDAFGAAQEAHGWPAQKLLDYGNAIMATLQPDSVYVGGTDPGRWIPALMNTSDGERHIVITQNGLADPKYLEYVQFLYGDRFAALAPEDGTAAQKAYLQDARKRLENKQLLPGEDVRLSTKPLESGFADGEVQASGMTSVMAVNELLLNKLLEKNPNLSFALEESFPMASINKNATPLGPIMQLRSDEQNALTKERAAQTVEYWREQTQRLMADPEFLDSEYAKKSYSKLVSSQGGLLQQRKYLAEAEEAYRFANELCPYSPEAVFRYINLLVEQQRFGDALRVTDNALKADPNNATLRAARADLSKMQKR